MSKKTANSALQRLVAGIAFGGLTAGCVAPPPAVDAAPRRATSPSASSTTAPISGSTAAASQPAEAATPNASTAPTIPPTPSPTTPTPPVLPFSEAVAYAARAVFSAAPPPDSGAITVVIDPLVDGMTGYQSKATQNIQDRIMGVVKKEFPMYQAQRITPENLKRQPRVLIGTFTPVTAQMKTTGGDREFYRFCLVMADLGTGKIVAKSVVRIPIREAEADATPTAAFGDSPAWTEDPSVKAYIATCQASKVGDPIKPEYIEGLLAAALISEAIDAYDEGHYAEALDLYKTAHKTPLGEQLRVYNGIYLSLTKLARTDQATAAFRDLVDFGLRTKRLAVKILFRPGSVRFANDGTASANYDMWLHQIAAQSVASRTCLQVVGHTSPSGPAAMNDSLSLLRAEYVQSRLEGDAPSLRNRTVAAGVGSRENLIGTGRDDATDMLDRRVEFKPIEPCT
jgi:outer membrane protein OmpA-like peptidoglycan-associated protein